MGQAVVQQHADNLQSTFAIFCIVDYLTKYDRPYIDHPHLLDLQHLNCICCCMLYTIH